MAENKLLLRVRDFFKAVAALIGNLVPEARVTVMITLREDGLLHTTMFTTEHPDVVLSSLRRMLAVCEEQDDPRGRIIVPEAN